MIRRLVGATLGLHTGYLGIHPAKALGPVHEASAETTEGCGGSNRRPVRARGGRVEDNGCNGCALSRAQTPGKRGDQRPSIQARRRPPGLLTGRATERSAWKASSLTLTLWAREDKCLG